jgi:DNA replication and repair protein RecF
MWIESLNIQQFRNIGQASLTVPANAGAIAVVGPNGAGKTSVLEALSLLTPGRGLHRASPDEMTQRNQPGWGVFAAIRTGADTHKLGMDYTAKKRRIKLDGEMLGGSAPLAALGSVVWFTPEMDRLFFDGPAPRRRFFDRLTFGLFPNHAEHLTRYTHHLQARAKLLKDGGDPDWITLEEKQAAHWGAKVLAARQAYLDALTPHLPAVTLRLTGSAEKLTADTADPADALLAALTDSRARDRRFATTHVGPHRTDLNAVLEGAVSLSEASMGQHKRALLHVLIAHAALLKQTRGHPPCLLLDEATAHLDKTNRGHLFGQLIALGSQLWLTGTDADMFDTLPNVRFLHADAGRFTWQK